MAFAAHQCAQFSADPCKPHTKAVKWLGRYLKMTWDKDLILKPARSSFDIYINADFARNWN